MKYIFGKAYVCVRWVQSRFGGVARVIKDSIVVSVIIWVFGQTNIEFQSYRQKQAEYVFLQYQDALAVSAELVARLYPLYISGFDEDDKKSLAVLWGKFEGFYWGKYGLIVDNESEACFKNIRTSLIDGLNGWRVAKDNLENNKLLNMKLEKISKALRVDYENKTRFWSFADSRSSVSNLCR